MAASPAASSEKTVSSTIEKRRGPVLSDTSSSIRFTAAMATSASTVLRAARTPPTAASGSALVRTAKVMKPSPACARGKYTCTRFSASSPSCIVCPTTPTTVIQCTTESVKSLKVIRLPIGSTVGQ